jgi:hypothetical protein
MPRAGDRMPDCALLGHHDGQSLLDLLRHGGFTLLVCSRGEKSPAAVQAQGVVTEHLRPASPELLADGAKPQCYLVRPDGYLALRCPVTESAKIAGYLRDGFS